VAAVRWRELLVGVGLGVAGYGVALLFPPGWRLILEGALVAWIGAIDVGLGLADLVLAGLFGTMHRSS